MTHSQLDIPADGMRSMAARLTLAPLEEWMRLYYFNCEIDLGSSGVQDFSLAEVRRLAGISVQDLDALVLQDSESLGGAELRQVIADCWAQGDVSRAMATHGSTEATFLIMQSLLRPGDEVVVVDPCYQQLFAIAEAIGCRLHRYRLRPEEGFVPDIDALCDCIGPKTRLVVVNFPHNPTGACLTAAQQQQLLAAAEKVGAYLFWDGAFQELTYDDPPLPAPNNLYERAISSGTFSKCYGLPGLRFGWCIAPPEVLREAVRLRDYMTLHLSPLTELLARRVLENSEAFVDPRRRQARRNLDTVTEWALAQQGYLEWHPPRGGVCGFPGLPRVADEEAFCHFMGDRYKILLVPGTCFGYPGHVRLGFGGDPKKLEDGLERLQDGLRRYRPGSGTG